MVNLLPTVRLAQPISKCKFPSVDKPLQKQAPQKRPLKNLSPGAYFRNFTVFSTVKHMQTSSLNSVIGNVQRYFLSSYSDSLGYLKILQGS